MNRRDLLGLMLVGCAAPAIVRADSLMRIVPREMFAVVPEVPFHKDAFILRMEYCPAKRIWLTREKLAKEITGGLYTRSIDLTTSGLPNR